MDLDDLVATMPHAVALGMTLTEADAARVAGTVAWAEERCTIGGLLHGGVLMAFADSLAAICAYLNLPEGASTTTTSSSTVFLRGVREGEVTATAEPLHAGRTTIVVQTALADASGRPVAQVTQSQAVLDEEEEEPAHSERAEQEQEPRRHEPEGDSRHDEFERVAEDIAEHPCA